MNRLFLMVISAVFISAFFACNNKDNIIEKGDWQLVWHDEFDGDRLNDAYWSKIPRGKSDWNKYMSDFEGLYAVENGNLILRGRSNDVLPNDTAHFLTGGVFTKGKQNFDFGRIEIKAKLNSAKGAWPAFWMLPIEAKWPNGGEIDIMEHLNHDSFIYQTVHSKYTYVLKIRDNPPSSTIVGINKNDYNIYAMERHQDSIVFYVNNVLTKTYPRISTDKEGQFPFADSDFYILLDMQLGGSWVGDIDTEQLPVEMYIDWIRFYKNKKDIVKK